jgi:hypothetical protein
VLILLLNIIHFESRFHKKRHKKRARDRVRTGDIQLGRLTLYQLSYSRFSNANIALLYKSLKK